MILQYIMPLQRLDYSSLKQNPTILGFPSRKPTRM
jgi:hypothetical protein